MGPRCPKCRHEYEWSCGEIEEQVTSPKFYFCEKCRSLFILSIEEVRAIQKKFWILPDITYPLPERPDAEPAAPEDPWTTPKKSVYEEQDDLVVVANDGPLETRLGLVRGRVDDWLLVYLLLIDTAHVGAVGRCSVL